MNARNLDIESLLDIAPEALATYARDAGWSQSQSYGKHSYVYTGVDLPEIVLPTDPNLRDYVTTVSRLIAIFSEVRNQDPQTVCDELRVMLRDVVRIRAVDESITDSIALVDSVKLMKGAHKLLLAAARSYYGPQVFYQARATGVVREYMNGLRLARTAGGSFMLEIVSDPTSVDAQTNDTTSRNEEGDDAAYTVTHHLAALLSATDVATHEGRNGELALHNSFNEAIDSGVSVNSCLALVELINPFSEIEIIVLSSISRSGQRGHTVRFSAADVPMLRDAAEFLRFSRSEADVTISGVVESLRRYEGRSYGVVAIREREMGRSRLVHVRLPRREYEVAVDAHNWGRTIVLSGDLMRLGHRHQLYNPIWLSPRL